MNVACPGCGTVYRIDPGKVSAGRTRTRCRQCAAAFLIPDDPLGHGPGRIGAGLALRDPEGAPEIDAPAQPEDPAASGPVPSAPSAPAPGTQDPEARARRLARALVSDLKVYNEDRWRQSRAEGTLRKDFRDEILRSWEEYVTQVGEGLAKGTPFFREALNEILAEGDPVF
jgi:predicted Zn finger-like uncharacterized protein